MGTINQKLIKWGRRCFDKSTIVRFSNNLKGVGGEVGAWPPVAATMNFAVNEWL